MLCTLGPTSTSNVTQLTELEYVVGGIVERVYPYASADIKLVFAKLTGLVTLIDDSIEDEAVYAAIVQFSQKLYLGEAQQNRMLGLYHKSVKELSEIYGNDAVLRVVAVVPWITFIDGCLMEKDILTAEVRSEYNHC
jgi:hypothetical protein